MMKTLEILYDDEHYVAVNKPPHLAAIPGRGEKTSVLEVLAAQLGLPRSGEVDPRLRVVHRIDKETSGVLLLAKHKDAQRHVSEQFQNNRVEKEYLALVAGRPAVAEGEVDAPMAPHPEREKLMIVSKHGRPARTGWRVEQRFKVYTLIRAFPKTGKTHQIRVHMKHAGMPLAIDSLYNPKPPSKPVGIFLSTFKRDYRPTRGQDERPLIERLTLHAERLRFTHLDGRAIELVAPLPKDFRATITQLSRHG